MSLISNSPDTFLLRSKGKTLGRVIFENEDWPWNYGCFLPWEDFLEFANIFSEEERLSQQDGSENRRQQTDRVVAKIVDLELQLIRDDSGNLAGEPDILWIRSGRVSWRGHSGNLRAMIRSKSGK